MPTAIFRTVTASLFAVGIFFMTGCVGNDGDGGVPYREDTETFIPDTGTAIPYDTDPDPNASFNFNLSGLPFVGVNMSGSEWDGESNTTRWPNQWLNQGYSSYLKWFRGWGMTTVRLPFKWEYLQRDLGAELDPEELYELELTVFHLREYRAKVLIDMHNYARYDGDLIGSEEVSYEDYADVWRRLAERFKAYPEVMFGIMNEPHSISTMQWVEAANAAIAAIRATGAKNLIFINGNGWSGAHSWYQTWYDASGDNVNNATAMLEVVDPLGDDYLIFEAHQYLNYDSSDWGTCECRDEHFNQGCTNETVGSFRMQKFTDWLREHGKKGYLGEFGSYDDSTCIAALDDMLNHLKANDDVYVGWAWWSAGPGCSSWQDPIDPHCWNDKRLADLEANGVDGPEVYEQVKLLKRHMDTY